jgi:hypothetical protein
MTDFLSDQASPPQASPPGSHVAHDLIIRSWRRGLGSEKSLFNSTLAIPAIAIQAIVCQVLISILAADR